MRNLEKLFAEKLLKIKAVKIQPANPFTWASGWKSPFYCDNRKTLSYPSLRNFVKTEITRLILERFGQVDAIAGVATGAIPQGALVADALNLPFVYVRSTPKDHGLENLIEGELRPGYESGCYRRPCIYRLQQSESRRGHQTRWMRSYRYGSRLHVWIPHCRKGIQGRQGAFGHIDQLCCRARRCPAYRLYRRK